MRRDGQELPLLVGWSYPTSSKGWR